jgi:hypothetical protein
MVLKNIIKNMNIKKIENGFSIDDIKMIYEFDGDAEILSNTECHIPTSNGILFFDIIVTINDQVYETIEEFIYALYS